MNSEPDCSAVIERIARALDEIAPRVAYAMRHCKKAPYNHRCSYARFCPSCAQYRSWLLRCKYGEAIAEMTNPYFLTVTGRAPITLSRRHVRWFLGRLKSLRRCRRFKRSISGGIYAVEVELSDNKRWNIHAHMLIDVADPALTEAIVRQIWHKRTRAFIVDLKPITRATADVLDYSAKSPSHTRSASKEPSVIRLFKPHDLLMDQDRLKEYFVATKGLRAVQTFGSFN